MNGATSTPDDTNTASVLFGGASILMLKDNGGRIARGSFGVVDVGLLRLQSGGLRLIALKRISQAFTDKSKTKLTTSVAQEVKSLKLLSGHKNIVGLLAVMDHSSPPALVLAMEYCPVDLQTSIEWRRRSYQSLLSINVVQMIAHEIVLGVGHCHDRGIVHRDIRPANLLVSSQGYVKLCDFGLALPIGTSLSRPQGIGLCSLQYRPPEVLLGGSGDHPQSDVFSIGLVVAELLSGKILFDGRGVIDQLQKMIRQLGAPRHDSRWFSKLPDFHTFRFEESHPNAVQDFLPRSSESPFLSKFIQDCLSIEPGGRPSNGGKLLHHAWFDECKTEHWRIAEQTIPPEMTELFFLTDSLQSGIALARKQSNMRHQFLHSLVKW